MSQNIYNVLFQIGSGLAIGTLVDMIFSRGDAMIDSTSMPTIGIETFGQLVVDAYVAGLFLDTMAAQALPLSAGVGSAPFFIFFFGSQMHLHKRINGIMMYIKTAINADVPFVNTFAADSPTAPIDVVKPPLAGLYAPVSSSSSSSAPPMMNGSRQGFNGGPYSKQPNYGGQAGNFNMYNPAMNDY